ncbi:MAG: serine/threonine-protein kinase [Planctomycetota bacterium]
MGPGAGVSVPPSLLHRFLGDDSNDEFHRTASRVLTNLSARLSNDVQRQKVGESPKRLGAYRIEAPLGHGGMGTVYRGVHETTGKAVAIKTAPAGSELAAILREEASALGGIDHRGVVQVFDHGVDGEIAWMAMQLVRGQTLRTLFEERWSNTSTPLSQLEVARFLGWMCEVASALHAMHQKGLVHRDVKPSNLMIADDGAAYVIDFGLSLDVSADPIVDALAGTVPYMSPEQVLAMTQLDGRSDIYSLAACFYELLSGRKLVVADERRVGVFREIAFGIAKPLSSVAAGVSKVYDGVFAKALAKDPAMRYATALDFATDVQRVQKGKAPLFAREPIALALSRRWRSIVAGVAVVSALAALGDAWWQRRALLADFRARCATARDGDADSAIDALTTALRLREDFAGDREFEDVYGNALTNLAPRMTQIVFQRAALVPSKDAGQSIAGQICAMAEEHLVALPSLPSAARIELSVQNAFHHIRADRMQDAIQVLRALSVPASADSRVKVLVALVHLMQAEELGGGNLSDVRALALSLNADHANLRVDELCCRGMLLLELANFDRVGALVPTTREPGDLASHAGTFAALERLEVALSASLRSTSIKGDTGNLVASLLALARLRLGEPRDAQIALEDRLAQASDRPVAGERSAMVLYSAVAGFRGLVQADSTSKLELERVVMRFREAAEYEPELTRRFVNEVGRGDSAPGGSRMPRFQAVCAEFLDELMKADAKPVVFTPWILMLARFAAGPFSESKRIGLLVDIAACAAENPNPMIPDGPREEVDSRIFWYWVVKMVGQRNLDGSRYATASDHELLDLDRRLWAASSRMLPGNPVEVETAYWYSRSLLEADDHDARERLVAARAMLANRHDALPPEEVYDPLRQAMINFLAESAAVAAGR